MNSSPAEPSRRIALFGGSFDPIHRGHLGMAETARTAAELEAVVFLPCFVSPFKEGTHATPEQRAEMISLALAEAGADWAELSRFEIERPTPSYTWETARHYAGTMPGIDWHWIVGTDQWDRIETWAEPETLRRLLRFLVVTREGGEVRDREGWRYEAIAFDHPASSTRIREDFDAHREWLTPAVWEYCREHGLYR